VAVAEWIVRGKHSRRIAFCRRHHHVLPVGSFSDFHLRAAEKAPSCEELDFLECCWYVNRGLGEAFLAGDLTEATEVLKKLPGDELKKLNTQQVLRRLETVPSYPELVARFLKLC
jgi:hypothetical protein